MKTPTGRESVVGEFRRRQIIDAAADAIAAEGLSRVSLSRIAAKAALSSTGLITYHFGSRQRLLQAIADDVAARHLTALDEAVQGCTTATEALERYVAATVTFQDQNRSAMQAGWQIVWLRWSRDSAVSDHEADGDGQGSVITTDALTLLLEDILERGRAAGEFRSDFAVSLMAKTINSAAFGYMDVVASASTPDPDVFIAHVQQTFIAALRP